MQSCLFRIKQIRRTLMAKTETLNLRVSPDFKRRLAEEAAKEKRSVTNYLEVTLMDFWQKKDKDTSSGEVKKKRAARG